MFTKMCLRLVPRARFLAAVAALTLFAASPLLHAADNSEEFDNYKVRADLFWFYSNPTGTFQGTSSGDVININRDLHFDSYSTFSGILDWKFTHKNHLTLAISPFQQSRTAVLNRTITYQGQTYNVGATVGANLKANLYAPGYAYDIIRRRRGHIGVGVQIDLFDTKASLSAKAQVTGGGTQQAFGLRERFAAGSDSGSWPPISLVSHQLPASVY